MTRRKALAEASVELTPLIDVVLLLLIFFMVSATFIRESQLGIELPAASGEPRAMHPATVEVAVDRGGAYRVNGNPVAGDSPPDLLAAMVEARDKSSPGKVRLVIAADARSTHRAVVMALEAAGQAGLKRISLLTRQRDDPATPAAGSTGPGAAPPDDGGERNAP